MFLRKRAQSTAEYAITIGLVIAVTAGILQMALKGGIRQKNKQALNYLLDAGKDQLGGIPEQDEALYSQEYRSTTVKGGDQFADESVMKKGGAEEKIQKQTTETTAVSVENIKQVNPTN